MKRHSTLLLTLFFFISALLLAQKAHASWYVNEYGQLTYSQPSVLGDDSDEDKEDNSGSGSSNEDQEDEKEEEKDDDNSGPGSSSNENKSEDENDDNSGSSSSGSSSSNSGSSFSFDSDDENDDNESEVEYIDPVTGFKTKTEIRGDESQTEMEFGEGERVRTEVRDGRTRTDVYSGGVKVRLERKADGRLKISAENEAGEEVELGDDEIFSIRERLETDTIRVGTGEDDSFVFARGNAGAQTQFPLSVNLETNELIVTTPAGERTVTVLPDAAVSNLLVANIIDRLGPDALAAAAQNAELGSVESIVNLGERNGVPIYEISGVSDQRLLGFIPVEIERTAVVSAETGEILDINTPILDTLLDTLSF